MKILAGTAARSAILASLGPMRRAVGANFGPSGRLVIGGGSRPPRPLRTGYDIARFISRADGRSNVGLRLVLEALHECDRDLGDGTARLALMCEAMLREGTQLLDQGHGPEDIAASLVDATDRVCEHLAALARGADPRRMALSACGDEEIADAIAELVAGISEDGIIAVEAQLPGDRPPVEAVHEGGFAIALETLDPALRNIELQNLSVLVANEEVSDFGDLLPVIESFPVHGRSLAIIARAFDGDARRTLVLNQSQFAGRILALCPTSVASEAARDLYDIAAATGAEVVDSSYGTTLSSLRPGMLGRCGKAVLRQGTVSFTGSKGDPATIVGRAAAYREEANRSKFLSLDRERYRARAARLAGQSGRLRVADAEGLDPAARREGARRAVAAVFSSLKSGGIGGGSIFAAVMASHCASCGVSPGQRCLLAAATVIEEHLARNAGGREQSPSGGKGGVVASLIDGDDVWVVDPLALTQEILRRATSLVTQLLAVEVLIVRPGR